MTPAEQTRLPWILEGGAETLGMIQGHLMPMLRRSHEVDPEDRKAPFAKIARSDGRTIMEASMMWLETTHERTVHWFCTILVMPECLTAIGYQCDETMGPDAMAAITDLIARMAAARRSTAHDDLWETEGLPSVETANAVVTRMSERTGAPVMPGERFYANRATPLGTGGVRIAARTHGSRARNPDHAVLVDASAWACRPGTIRVSGGRAIHRLTGAEHRQFTFGDHAVAGETVPVDPFAMLRLEAEHPWNPADIRIERGRSE